MYISDFRGNNLSRMMGNEGCFCYETVTSEWPFVINVKSHEGGDQGNQQCESLLGQHILYVCDLII